jgi:hypothetical protein
MVEYAASRRNKCIINKIDTSFSVNFSAVLSDLALVSMMSKTSRICFNSFPLKALCRAGGERSYQHNYKLSKIKILLCMRSLNLHLIFLE